MDRKPLAESLKEANWQYEDYYWIEFKGDRVISFAKSLPH